MSLDQYISPPVLLSAFTLILTWFVLQWWTQNRKLPPGPWGLPFFGYFPFIKKTHVAYAELSKIYGKIFSFRTIGGRLIIVLNGADLIKEVLVNRSDEFSGRIPGNNLISWVSNGLGVIQEEGEIWSEHRRFFLQAAKNFGFGKLELEDRIHDEIRQMLAEFHRIAPKAVDVSFHVGYVTNTIISHILFNKKFEKTNIFANHLTTMNMFVQTFIGKNNLLLGYLFDLWFAFLPTLNKRRDALRKLTDDIVDEQIQTLDSDHPRGYVDVYLRQRNDLIKKGKADGGSFTKERLQAISMNMFFEGTESTSTTTTALLKELSKHPEVQKKVQEELDSVVGIERLPSWADRQKLPYVDATILELYRLAAPFLTTVYYSNFKETTIEGYKIPKRSAIVSSLFSIHFDPVEFPNPEKFDPKRFLNEEGKRIKREGPYPFGLGKRSCIGESLAQMEVFLIVSCILQNFTLRPGDDDQTMRVIPRK